MTRSEIHAWQSELNTILDRLNTLGEQMDDNGSVYTTEYNDLCEAISHLESVQNTLNRLEERQSREWPDTFDSFISKL